MLQLAASSLSLADNLPTAPRVASMAVRALVCYLGRHQLDLLPGIAGRLRSRDDRPLATVALLAELGLEVAHDQGGQGRNAGTPAASAVVATLDGPAIGIDPLDPRLLVMAAAAAQCHPNELMVLSSDPTVVAGLVQSVGGRGILLRRGATPQSKPAADAVIASVGELDEVINGFERADRRSAGDHGVGPMPRPWPLDSRLDARLLASGDHRNVIDRYRYWHEEAIKADLDNRSHGLEVAVENWRHDRNIGTVVRNANAFGARRVHIIGQRRWNRRGAMATDRYLSVDHHPDVASFLDHAQTAGLAVVAVDNVAGSVPIETAVLPPRSVLVFGQEGPGLSPQILDQASLSVAITQYGSTRSLNAGVASGIAMYAWMQQNPGRRP